MSQYNTVEEYAASVETRTRALIGSLCHRLGPEHKTTLAVLELLNEANAITVHTKMRQEQEGDYDLSLLKVDVGAPSSSETVWDWEE